MAGRGSPPRAQLLALAALAVVAVGAATLPRAAGINDRDRLLRDKAASGERIYDPSLMDMLDEDLDMKPGKKVEMHIHSGHNEHSGHAAPHHHGKRKSSQKASEVFAEHDQEGLDDEVNLDNPENVKSLSEIAAAEMRKKHDIYLEGRAQKKEIQRQRDIHEEESLDKWEGNAIPHARTKAEARAGNERLMMARRMEKHMKKAHEQEEVDANLLDGDDLEASAALDKSELEENPIEYEGDEGAPKVARDGADGVDGGLDIDSGLGLAADELDAASLDLTTTGYARKKLSTEERDKWNKAQRDAQNDGRKRERGDKTGDDDALPEGMHFMFEDSAMTKANHEFDVEEAKRIRSSGWEKEPLPASEVSEYRAVLVMADDREIELGFYEREAPMTVKHILDCVRAGLYETDDFFRVDKGFVAQVADVTRRRLGVPEELRELAERKVHGEFKYQNFPNKPESIRGHYLLDHTVGRLSMARFQDPDSGTSSFSVMLGDSPHLNDQYTIFGEVTRGLEVVQGWQDLPTEKKGIFVVPKERIEIKRTYILHDPAKKRIGRNTYGHAPEPPAKQAEQRPRHSSSSQGGRAARAPGGAPAGGRAPADGHADLEDMSHEDMKDLVKHLRGELHKTRQKLLP